MEGDGSRDSVTLDVNSFDKFKEDYDNQLGDAYNQPNIIDNILYYKAAKGHFDVFGQHDEDSLKQLVTRFDKNTILHIYLTARRPRTAKSADFLNEVLAKCKQLLWQPNEKGETILHTAARKGLDDIVQVLLSKDKEAHCNGQTCNRSLLLGMVNKVGDTALHEAVRHSHLRVVKILIHEDCNYPYCRNNDGETPLYIAAEKGARKVVHEILGACESPAYQGPDGRTALHAAVLCNDKEMVKLLLGKFKKLTRKADKLGWTPLHYAAYHGHLSIAKLLLKEDQNAAYIPDRKEKKTALHVAASQGKANVVKELMLTCPDCFEQVDKNGRNVLHFAVEKDNNIYTLHSILENECFSNLINSKDDLGNTPLHHTAISDTLAAGLIIHPNLNTQVFNKKNLSPLDIITAQSECSWRLNVTAMALEIVDKRRNLRITDKDESNKIGEKKEEDGMKKDELVQKRRDTSNKASNGSDLENLKEINLVVATLIATVTFAAGFTMPGGYGSENDRNHQGLPVLIRMPAFKVFVFSNTIALVLCSSVVFLHLSRRMFTSGTALDSEMSLLGTFSAMIAMVVAFVSGTCAVLAPSPSLVTAICAVSGSLFGLIFYYQRLSMLAFSCVLLFIIKRRAIFRSNIMSSREQGRPWSFLNSIVKRNFHHPCL